MATKKPKAPVKKEKRPWIVTPIGFMNYAHLAKPDLGRQYSDGKYKLDLLFPKDTWKEEGANIRKAVILEARKYFQDDSLTLKDFKHPFKDGDEKDMSQEANKYYKGMIYITPKCSGDYPPGIVGPSKETYSLEDINKMKNGDKVRCVVDAYPYEQQGGGITLGLKTVQFVMPGKPFGVSGQQAAINILDDLPEDLIADLDLGDDEDGEESESDDDDTF